MGTENSKSKIWIIVPVIVILVGGIYWVWAKNSRSKTNSDTKSAQQINTNSQSEKSSTAPLINDGSSDASQAINENENSDELDDNAPDEQRSNETADENFRQGVMAYAMQNLNTLAEPPKNDKWEYPTFDFVGNSHVYIEFYAEETDLGGYKILYQADKDGSSYKLTELARNTETEDDWALKSGKDDYENYVMDVYDYNEKTKKWEKSDESDDTIDDTGADSTDSEN